MNRSYMTPSRRAVMSLFCSYPHRQFTSEQVCTLLCESNPEGTALLGKSTVYRQLSRLCEEGVLLREAATDGASGAVHVYRYASPEEPGDSGFRLQCRRCGRVTALSCEFADSLIAHLHEHHGFMISGGESLLCGVCRDCQQSEKQKED